MRRAPVREAKNDWVENKARAAPVRLSRTHAHAMIAPLQSESASMRAPLPGLAPLQHQGISSAQSAYGNQAVLRTLNRASTSRKVLQRKCACDGAGGADCAACQEKAVVSPQLAPVLQRQPQQGAEPENKILSKECWAASELVTLGLAKMFGEFAHQIVSVDYCLKMGCSLKDNYFDKSDAGPIDSGYVSFITRKNQGKVPPWKLDVLKAVAVSRPDILTHKPLRKDFYEVKPNSASGLAAGQAKLTLIDDYMRVLGLPYTRGIAYTPTEEISLGAVPFGTYMALVSLELKRVQSGLIAYKVCFTHASPEYIWEQIKDGAILVLAFIMALIALFWLKGRMPAGGGSFEPEYVPVYGSADTDASKVAGEETA
jgi:hypothetical protein